MWNGKRSKIYKKSIFKSGNKRVKVKDDKTNSKRYKSKLEVLSFVDFIPYVSSRDFKRDTSIAKDDLHKKEDFFLCIDKEIKINQMSCIEYCVTRSGNMGMEENEASWRQNIRNKQH